MKLRALASVALAAQTALAFSACSGGDETVPLDARTAALTADRNFRHVAVELAGAARFLAESQALGTLLAGDCTVEPAPDGSDAPDCGEPVDFEAGANALAEVLATRVFTEANVESTEGGTVTFRLRPEVVCSAYDDECLEVLGRVPVRLLVSSDAPGDLDVDVQVGEPAVSPFHLALHSEDLLVEADLGALQHSLEMVEQAPLEVTMAGRVGLALSREGEGRFTSSLSILDPVAVVGLAPDAPQIHVARAVPALSVTVDGNTREARVAAGLAAVDLRGPIQALLGTDEGEIACDENGLCEELAPTDYEGTVGLHLGGLTGSTTLVARDGSDELRVDDLGLGAETTVLDLDGAPLLAVDLNPLTGRALDLIATVDEGGTTLRLAPGLDLRIALDFANAASQFEVPGWALEEELRIRLDGAASPRVRIGEAEQPPAADAFAPPPGPLVQVLEGALHLESELLAPIEVEAGMCLVQAEPDASWPDHPFSGIAAGSCG